jgi:membrane protein required for colicin V production
MDINYFDIIVGITILLLGLKGILNGFFKELFGLVGIIGGIFIASRMGEAVGEYLSNLIFHFSNSAAINFTGFMVTLILFWIVMIVTGYAFKKLTSLSGLGIFDRIFGFLFATGKFFLIAAVIAFSLNNVKAFKPTIDSALANSILYPVLVETGAFIMKINPQEVTGDLNTTVADTTQKISQKINEQTQKLIDDKVKENINEIKEEIKKEK